MQNYLNYKFEDSIEFINTFDELPLWSASFGLLLLKHLELKPNLTVLDIGSGAGFPLFELAGRLGSSCKLFGIDPWKNANIRAKQKIINYNYSNVEIIESSAETLPFDANTIDLIVSNLGINNFDDPKIVFDECNRVLKSKGKLVLTTNLNGHWREFYKIFESVLFELGKFDTLQSLIEHQNHRGSVESISKMFTNSGFRIVRNFEESFVMNFLDGSAFLNHYFVKVGWLGSWKELVSESEFEKIFLLLEKKLNEYAFEMGGLKLTVPMTYIEGEKD